MHQFPLNGKMFVLSSGPAPLSHLFLPRVCGRGRAPVIRGAGLSSSIRQELRPPLPQFSAKVFQV